MASATCRVFSTRTNSPSNRLSITTTSWIRNARQFRVLFSTQRTEIHTDSSDIYTRVGRWERHARRKRVKSGNQHTENFLDYFFLKTAATTLACVCGQRLWWVGKEFCTTSTTMWGLHKQSLWFFCSGNGSRYTRCVVYTRREGPEWRRNGREKKKRKQTMCGI